MFYVQIIDRAMKLYKQECESSPYEEDVRRYREVHAMYIADEPKTVQQISELENVSDKTVYNDFRIACACHLCVFAWSLSFTGLWTFYPRNYNSARSLWL